MHSASFLTPSLRRVPLFSICYKRCQDLPANSSLLAVYLGQGVREVGEVRDGPQQGSQRTYNPISQRLLPPFSRGNGLLLYPSAL